MAILDTRNVHKILVRSTNWIGDAVMTTPALGSLRSAFPDSEIVLAANPAVSELMTPHPFCDRVIVYDKKGPHKGIRGFLRFCSALAEERFDLAVLLQNAIEAAIMARLAKIRTRAGYRTDGRGFLLTHGVSVPRGTFHHTAYYLQLLESLGIGPGERKLRLLCARDEIEHARHTLGPGRWAAVNPGAAFGSAKRWRPERFAAVADALTFDHGFNVVLLGGPGEAEIGLRIVAGMRSRPVNRIGATSIREMMAILSQVELVVTNDSGPMHVAAAFDRPIVALFGPTDPLATSPLCSRFRIVRVEAECAPCFKRRCPGDHRCMANLSAEHVLLAVEDLLGPPGAGPGSARQRE